MRGLFLQHPEAPSSSGSGLLGLLVQAGDDKWEVHLEGKICFEQEDKKSSTIYGSEANSYPGDLEFLQNRTSTKWEN